jgi:hypothetical protein
VKKEGVVNGDQGRAVISPGSAKNPVVILGLRLDGFKVS